MSLTVNDMWKKSSSYAWLIRVLEGRSILHAGSLDEQTGNWTLDNGWVIEVKAGINFTLTAVQDTRGYEITRVQLTFKSDQLSGTEKLLMHAWALLDSRVPYTWLLVELCGPIGSIDRSGPWFTVRMVTDDDA